MRKLSWLVLAALACAFVAAGGRSPATAADCRAGAIERLRAASPQGFAVYQAIKDKAFFLGWLSCEEAALGHSTFVGIRDKAQRLLGAKYDIKEYHEAVLAGGRLPLEILQAQGDAWIARRMSA